MFKWKLGWMKAGDTCTESCPDCASEVEAELDGSTFCVHCGHPEILPCAECVDRHGYWEGDSFITYGDYCDWEKYTRCTPFRRELEFDEEELRGVHCDN